MMRFAEQPTFGQPGHRTCSERRALTANYEITEFGFGVSTDHRAEGLYVAVTLVGDQPRHGFFAVPVYHELHSRPEDGASPDPEYVLQLESQVIGRFAARLSTVLRDADSSTD